MKRIDKQLPAIVLDQQNQQYSSCRGQTPQKISDKVRSETGLRDISADKIVQKFNTNSPRDNEKNYYFSSVEATTQKNSLNQTVKSRHNYSLSNQLQQKKELGYSDFTLLDEDQKVNPLQSRQISNYLSPEMIMTYELITKDQLKKTNQARYLISQNNISGKIHDFTHNSSELRLNVNAIKETTTCSQKSTVLKDFLLIDSKSKTNLKLFDSQKTLKNFQQTLPTYKYDRKRDDLEALQQWLIDQIKNVQKNYLSKTVTDNTNIATYEQLQIIYQSALNELSRQLGCEMKQYSNFLNMLWKMNDDMTTQVFQFMKYNYFQNNIQHLKESQHYHQEYQDSMKKLERKNNEVEKEHSQLNIKYQKQIDINRYLRKKNLRTERRVHLLEFELKQLQQDLSKYKLENIKLNSIIQGLNEENTHQMRLALQRFNKEQDKQNIKKQILGASQICIVQRTQVSHEQNTVQSQLDLDNIQKYDKHSEKVVLNPARRDSQNVNLKKHPCFKQLDESDVYSVNLLKEFEKEIFMQNQEDHLNFTIEIEDIGVNTSNQYINRQDNQDKETDTNDFLTMCTESKEVQVVMINKSQAIQCDLPITMRGVDMGNNVFFLRIIKVKNFDDPLSDKLQQTLDSAQFIPKEILQKGFSALNHQRLFRVEILKLFQPHLILKYAECQKLLNDLVSTLDENFKTYQMDILEKEKDLKFINDQFKHSQDQITELEQLYSKSMDKQFALKKELKTAQEQIVTEKTKVEKLEQEFLVKIKNSKYPSQQPSPSKNSTAKVFPDLPTKSNEPEPQDIIQSKRSSLKESSIKNNNLDSPKLDVPLDQKIESKNKGTGRGFKSVQSQIKNIIQLKNDSQKNLSQSPKKNFKQQQQDVLNLQSPKTQKLQKQAIQQFTDTEIKRQISLNQQFPKIPTEDSESPLMGRLKSKNGPKLQNPMGDDSHSSKNDKHITNHSVDEANRTDSKQMVKSRQTSSYYGQTPINRIDSQEASQVKIQFKTVATMDSGRYTKEKITQETIKQVVQVPLSRKAMNNRKTDDIEDKMKKTTQFKPFHFQGKKWAKKGTSKYEIQQFVKQSLQSISKPSRQMKPQSQQQITKMEQTLMPIKKIAQQVLFDLVNDYKRGEEILYSFDIYLFEWFMNTYGIRKIAESKFLQMLTKLLVYDLSYYPFLSTVLQLIGYELPPTAKDLKEFIKLHTTFEDIHKQNLMTTPDQKSTLLVQSFKYLKGLLERRGDASQNQEIVNKILQKFIDQMNELNQQDPTLQNQLGFIDYACKLVYEGSVQLNQYIVDRYYPICQSFINGKDSSICWEGFRTLVYPLNKENFTLQEIFNIFKQNCDVFNQQEQSCMSLHTFGKVVEREQLWSSEKLDKLPFLNYKSQGIFIQSVDDLQQWQKIKNHIRLRINNLNNNNFNYEMLLANIQQYVDTKDQAMKIKSPRRSNDEANQMVRSLVLLLLDLDEQVLDQSVYQFILPEYEIINQIFNSV